MGATLGESFDYIGSSRLVYDMMTDSFPYNLTAATQGDDSATLCMTRGIIKGLTEGHKILKLDSLSLCFIMVQIIWVKHCTTEPNFLSVVPVPVPVSFYTWIQIWIYELFG